jgi:adenylosuccinate synthase
LYNTFSKTGSGAFEAEANMPLDIVVGTQWGDEGKGRVVDLLAASTDYTARFNGGDNAGHTVTVGDQTFRLHLVPSGMIHPRCIGIIGNGVVINPAVLLAEMESLVSAGLPVSPKRLYISLAATIITPAHRALDAAQEAARGKVKLGTTLRGIGPAYTDKVSRTALRAGLMRQPGQFAQAVQEHVERLNHNLTTLYGAEPLNPAAIAAEYQDYARQLKDYVADVSSLLWGALRQGKSILAEGAQGTLLDLDHGTYPYVTSSNAISAGALTGLGLGVGCVERVIGVTKAFQTRVGSGPFPTEVVGEVELHLRGSGENPWDEFGTTTGRPRRVGWLDMVLLRYAARINGLTELAVTKLDILSGLATLQLCTSYRSGDTRYTDLPYGPAELENYSPVYEELAGWEQEIRSVRRWEELPLQARAYILRIEELSGVPVRLVSVGPERDQVVEIN